MQRGGIAGANEDARADDAADAKKDQVPRTQGPLELAVLGFALDLFYAFAKKQTGNESPFGRAGHRCFPLDFLFCALAPGTAAG